MTVSPKARPRVRPDTYLFFFVVIALIVFLTHAPLIPLPYYWDELGQFVPASLDLFHSGAWVPYSTLPNVHPPGVMAYLAGFWSLTGYSVSATRLAMLLLASLAGLVTFLLAIELCREAKGLPAFLAVLFLCVSPLFFAQAMLAQLDMPAMLFTCLALLLFLQERLRAAALVSTALVMVKETGIVAPFVFGCWLWFEGRRKETLWFTLPLVPLLVWLAVLRASTGHLFGNAAFTEYNVFYPLHPVRLGLALIRRVYYLFGGTFHWIGAIAVILALRRTTLFRNRAWAVATSFAVAHVLLVSAMGGAVLERYLMPVIPILYIAFAAAFSMHPRRWRTAAAAGLMTALLIANFVNPPYPFPFENNLAFSDFVTLHMKAADFLQARYPDKTIATTFPLAGALTRPEFGYVSRKLHVSELRDFKLSNVAILKRGEADVLVLYDVMWDPWDLMRRLRLAGLFRRFYDYEPQIGAEDVRSRLGMQPVSRWSRHGQWVEVFVRDSGLKPESRL